MSSKEYMSIGYIRSNCLSKVASLINDLPTTQFAVARTHQEKKKLDKNNYIWLQYNLRGIGDFQIKWNIWKHKTPFQTVLNQLSNFKNQYHFEDFVVNKFEIGIDDENLVEIINKKMNEVNEKKRFSSSTRFYITFTNKPIANDVINGWDAKVARDINLNAIVNLGFKRGVLDITHLESQEKKDNKKKNENIDFLIHEKEILENILGHLDTKKWFTFPEVIENFNPENGHHPYPGAVRTYERRHGFSKWAFITDEEVR